jgi:hypothetical protein
MGDTSTIVRPATFSRITASAEIAVHAAARVEPLARHRRAPRNLRVRPGGRHACRLAFGPASCPRCRVRTVGDRRPPAAPSPDPLSMGQNLLGDLKAVTAEKYRGRRPCHRHDPSPQHPPFGADRDVAEGAARVRNLRGRKLSVGDTWTADGMPGWPPRHLIGLGCAERALHGQKGRGGVAQGTRLSRALPYTS